MEINENIETITGDPKKAINKLAMPTIFSLLLMFLNNLIDSFWVSGINIDALAALGFISPLYLVLIGIGSGIGAGGNSLISRYVGASKFEDANNAVLHTIILTFIVSIFILMIGIFFLDNIIILVGAKDVMSYCIDYGKILFLLNIVFLLPNTTSSIFRAEGDVKRATKPLMLTAILNMILDPIFIYVFNLGIFGASVATILASLIGRGGRAFEIYKKILIVSLPASFEEIIFSIVAIVFNYLIIMTAGVNEVASFTIAWRYISIIFLPCMAIGIATITVSGIAYGAKNTKNFDTTIKYSTMISLAITLIISAIFFIFAYPLCELFSFQSGNIELVTRSSQILQILVFYNVLIPFGATAAYTYQGIGSGFKSLGLTVLRELILSMFFAYLLGIILNMEVFGVYLGAIIGMNLGSAIGFIFILIFNRKFKKEVENLEITPKK